jgi:long-subunit acyl-CoA synthetase (AMP-forming)
MTTITYAQWGMDTPLFNKLVFAPIKKITGGRLKFAISGGGPLDREVIIIIIIIIIISIRTITGGRLKFAISGGGPSTAGFYYCYYCFYYNYHQ